MSLYNQLFGVNPCAGALLNALGLSVRDVPRFRDCYLSGDHIVVYTRTGGPNRASYDSAEGRREMIAASGVGDPDAAYWDGPYNEDLRATPGFVRDEDDSFDTTFAYFHFEIPETLSADVVAAMREVGGEGDPAKRWADLMEAMEKDDHDNPDLKRAEQVAEQILKPLVEDLKGKRDQKGNIKIIKI